MDALLMEKCAAIIIREKTLLVVRKRFTNIFISPGGKIEPGETQIQCLRREVAEEIGVEISDALYFDSFEREAAFDHKIIIIHAWFVSVYGECYPNSEIEEIRWVNGKTRVPIASIFKDCVIPRLLAQDLIDE
ncbi:NUDIX hydrolase [Saliniramus fredricksonii]|nr:NUDIX domain-containing protein [Saliniramus fredricksonii]